MTIPRIVACLIFSQALGTMMQTMLRSMLFRWMDATSASTRSRWEDDHNSIPSAAVGRNLHRHVGSVTTTTTTHPSSSVLATSSGSAVCAICHRPRVYSACLATCGHVFCWKCLVSWISSSDDASSSSVSSPHQREYCPLCRKPGRIQDIILLQDYEIPPVRG
jgi:hypothetical protein